MPPRGILDPERRALYGASLQPPAGYVFDAGVATTYSMDFESALAAPVSLALFATENRDEILLNPLALLEGVERIAGRLLVFTDAGHIKGDVRPHSRICSLLERMVVEVAAPREGAFHPKMWALRFTPLRPEEPRRLRLLILSRNLTRDRCWDLALTLDGDITNQPKAINRPLADFVRALPGLATGGTPDGSRALVDELAEDLRRVEWSLPDPFQDVAFAVNGLDGRVWRPEACDRLGIISPFCDDETLKMLAALSRAEAPMLIGRSEELARLDGATLDAFDRVEVLADSATAEDGEEIEESDLSGLHAKVFVAERGWNASITVGSGNATRPALLSGANVEIFATLTGKRSQIGKVAEVLGEDGFGRMTRPFVRGELPPLDDEKRAAKARLDDARREICRSGLRLRCERAEASDGDAPLWRLWLVPSEPLDLAHVGQLGVWPITRGEGHARDLLAPLRQGQPTDLGLMPLVDLTRFLAFQLTDGDEDVSLLFSAGFAVDGLPAERNAAILRWVIDSREKFLRYIRMLLAEIGDPFSFALAAQMANGDGERRVAKDDAPIIEEMVRALCRGGYPMQAIERLMAGLGEARDGEPDPVPAEFRTLWNTFRVALNALDAHHD